MQVTLRLFGLNILPGLTDLIGKVISGGKDLIIRSLIQVIQLPIQLSI
jgi:hypothetical protein